MLEYYYLNGKEQKGPFTIEQLKEESITLETLVWKDGMEHWQKLKDIPALCDLLEIKAKVQPPPPPQEYLDEIKPAEVNIKPHIIQNNSSDSSFGKLQLSKKTITWLIIWTSFHLFALLMSYTQIRIFNNTGEQRTDKFWPLGPYNGCAGYGVYTHADDIRHRKNGTWIEYCFNGVFAHYDWSEFAIYVGGVLLAIIILKISKSKSF